jgi:hypothetical protein
MMKNYFKIIIFFFAGFIKSMQSQNLVPNCQFEKADTSICPPPGFVTINNDLMPWFEYGSADFLNACDTTGYVGVPKNRFGYQQAYSGRGYVGLIAYYSTLFNREYIETPLLSPLQNGQVYYVQFYVSLEDTMQYAIENLGALFTDTIYNPYPSSGGWVTGIPQVENLPGNMLNDKLNWTLVAGSFIADGGEQYLTIGNFKNDAQTVRQHLGGTTINTLGANYYIDDVYVGATPPAGIEEKEKQKLKLYPNPNSGNMILECRLQAQESGELIIYSTDGVVMKRFMLPAGTQQIIVDATDLKSGLYLYEMLRNGKPNEKGKLSIIK